jgi:hypothetical protein
MRRRGDATMRRRNETRREFVGLHSVFAMFSSRWFARHRHGAAAVQNTTQRFHFSFSYVSPFQ